SYALLIRQHNLLSLFSCLFIWQNMVSVPSSGYRYGELFLQLTSRSILFLGLSAISSVGEIQLCGLVVSAVGLLHSCSFIPQFGSIVTIGWSWDAAYYGVLY